jgi:hypothetical protein
MIYLSQIFNSDSKMILGTIYFIMYFFQDFLSFCEFFYHIDKEQDVLLLKGAALGRNVYPSRSRWEYDSLIFKNSLHVFTEVCWNSRAIFS